LAHSQRLERGQPASLETVKALASVFEIDLKDLQEPDMTSTDTDPGLKDVRRCKVAPLPSEPRA
jgi:hypothetical protein